MAHSLTSSILALLVADAAGHSQYLRSIPNGMRVVRDGESWYGVGHFYSMGSGPLNSFGTDFAAAGHQWTPELCAADSDGDGLSNGFELGDPECTWSIGGVPSRSRDISHPGFADSVPAASPPAAPPTESNVTSTTWEPTAATSSSTTAVPSSTTASSSTSSTSSVPQTVETSTMPESETEEPSTSAASTTTAEVAAPSTTEGSSQTSDPTSGAVACEFGAEPLFTGFFWDPSCELGMLGCLADGKNMQCRFCGVGNYSAVPCPPSSCHFPNEPFVPYYWDPSCEMGMLGCWADGIHAQCRFCGDHPYTSLECPEVVGGNVGAQRDTERGGPADEECSFESEPGMPYYWDPECSLGKLGCLADGIHEECRFCAHRPFEGIPCPVVVAPPGGRCTFAGDEEPVEMHFWDPSCEMGLLGCWADGRHAECRFCGGDGAFRNISCTASQGGGVASLPSEQLSSESPGASSAMASAGKSGVAQAVAKDVKVELAAGPTDDDTSEADLSGASGPFLLGRVVVTLTILLLAAGF